MVIIDISSMTMTCAFLKCSMILLGSRRMDKYLHVGIWNVVCIVMAVEFKWSAITPMVVHNNAFLPSNWKHVMYIKMKVLPLRGVLVTICEPYGFSIMEMCVKCVLQRFENKLHFVWLYTMKNIINCRFRLCVLWVEVWMML
jgi:hypothetical protein